MYSIDIRREGNLDRLNVSMVKRDGSPLKIHMTQPSTGGEGTADALPPDVKMFYKPRDSRHDEIVYMRNGSPVANETVTLSEDGKTMTVVFKGIRSSEMDSTLVLVKQ